MSGGESGLSLYTSRGVSGFATTLGSQVSGVIRKEGVGGLPGHSGHRVIHFHVPPNDLPCPVDGRERSWPLSLFLSSRPRSLVTCIGPGSTSPSGKISRSCFLPVSHPRLILSQKVCAGRIRTTVPLPGYNIQSLFRVLPQHTVALRCAKALELAQNGFLRGNQASIRVVVTSAPLASNAVPQLTSSRSYLILS